MSEAEDTIKKAKSPEQAKRNVGETKVDNPGSSDAGRSDDQTSETGREAVAQSVGRRREEGGEPKDDGAVAATGSKAKRKRGVSFAPVAQVSIVPRVEQDRDIIQNQFALLKKDKGAEDDEEDFASLIPAIKPEDFDTDDDTEFGVPI